MNAKALKCLTQVAKTLKVPVGKLVINTDLLPTRTHDNVTTTGFINIISEYLKHSKLNISVKTEEDQAEVLQWIEYAIVYAIHVESTQGIKHILGELNDVLVTRTYFVADTLSIADIVLYYVLQNIIANLSYLEKEKYVHVCRWFDNIQQLNSIKETSNPVDFKSIYLVNAIAARH